MKKNAIAFCLMLALISGACSSDDRKARDIFETAAFEEKQFNRDHAMELYEEIILNYPDSQVASQAEDCLRRLRNNGAETHE